MSPTSKTRPRIAGAALALLGAIAVLPLCAQGAESKVLNGIERGSDAAGRGIERGLNRAAVATSRANFPALSDDRAHRTSWRSNTFSRCRA